MQFIITLKPSNDNKEEKKLAEWRGKIEKASDKKLKLSLKVESGEENIIYCGTNPEEQVDGSKEANYWLDTSAKAFIVRRKNVIIIIDPGHGDDNSKNTVFDPGAVDGKEYEKDYALILGQAIKEELDKNDYVTYITRDDNIKVDPKGPLNWRYEFANEKKGDIFISFHLNSGKDKNVFSVYQQGKETEEDSKKLGKLIMNKLDSIVTVPTNNLRQVKGYTRFNTLAVLNNFKGKAALLMEFGGIANDENRKLIKEKKENIATAIVNAIKEYSNEAF